MDAKSLSTLGILNDLRHAASDTLNSEHKFPALLLLYSFIDVCASLASDPEMSNRQRFESYLNNFYQPGFQTYSPFDLWAARSSLLHAFSPLGHHTGPGKGAKPIFYYSHPQDPGVFESLLRQRGHTDFFLIDTEEIKMIAIFSFNALWSKVESDSVFKNKFLGNAEHLLKSYDQLLLEDWLLFVGHAVKVVGPGS